MELTIDEIQVGDYIKTTMGALGVVKAIIYDVAVMADDTGKSARGVRHSKECPNLKLWALRFPTKNVETFHPKNGHMLVEIQDKKTAKFDMQIEADEITVGGMVKIRDGLVAVTAPKISANEKAASPHIAGLSEESIDMGAYREFMRGL